MYNGKLTEKDVAGCGRDRF